jgi:phage baseplate assembly protein gpV
MISTIRSEIAKALRGLVPTAIGVIEAVDLKAYQVQCRLKTSGQLTNWLRIGTEYVGAGFGLAIAPAAGDEVLIEFLEWNPSGPGIVTRRLYGKDSPPSVDVDQVHFVHPSGTDILVKKDGSVEVSIASKSTTSTKSTSSTSAEGDLSLSSQAKITITAQGLCELSGVPTVNLNGSSFSAVIFEQLDTALGNLVTMLSSHTHLCAPPSSPSGPPVPPPVLVLAPAQSQKVKLGG